MTTALILFLVILLFSLLFADMGWSNVLSSTRNDVVFADRNRAYGAYKIRQEHHRVMILAFVAATAFLGAVFTLTGLLGSSGIPSPIPPNPGNVLDVVLTDLLPDDPEPLVPTHDEPAANPEKASFNPQELAIVEVGKTPDPPAWDSATVTKAPDPLPIGPGNPNPMGPVGPIGPVGPTSTVGGEGEGPHIRGSWEVDPLPEFPGGAAGLDRYYERTIEYPEKSEAIGEEGTVWVEFIVDSDGTVTRARIAHSVSKELDAEALRTIKLMPKWKPGRYKGDPVPVLFQQKIVFALDR